MTGDNEPSQTATTVEYRYNEGRKEGEEEGQDNHVTLSEGMHQAFYEYEPLSMTSGYFSNPLETPRNNDVRIMDYTTKHEGDYGFFKLYYGAQSMWLRKKAHPEVVSTSACPQCGLNNSSSTIAEAGDGPMFLWVRGWLSPYQGVFEATVHDPGIGVSFEGFTGSIGYYPLWLRNEKVKCLWYPVSGDVSVTAMTYNSSMPNGDDGVEFFAEDAAGLFESTSETVKVDASKPYNLGFTGMPEVGAEISAAPRKLDGACDRWEKTDAEFGDSVRLRVDRRWHADRIVGRELPGRGMHGEWRIHDSTPKASLKGYTGLSCLPSATRVSLKQRNSCSMCVTRVLFRWVRARWIRRRDSLRSRQATCRWRCERRLALLSVA